MIISTKYTHADLLAAPDDNLRREIIGGELYVTPSPIFRHQLIAQRLNLALADYLKTRPIGVVLFAPLDVIIGEHDVVEPDLPLVLNEHRSILQDWVRGAPDLAVEILSPGTAARDRSIKLRAYARYGIREYWIADPDGRTIEVYRLGSGGYELANTFLEAETLTSPLLPEFTLPLAGIFRNE